MKIQHKIILASALLGLFIWIISALIIYLVFSEGSFLEALGGNSAQHYIRLFILLSFIAFGVFMGRALGQRERAEAALTERTHDLSERIKELNCLYAIHEIESKTDISFEQMLQSIVEIIPLSWQYPDIACARITIDSKEYPTPNFTPTSWKLHAAIKAEREECGTIEVYYLKQMPQADKGPFLKEEVKLINAIAALLGSITEHNRAKVRLRQYTLELKEINVQLQENDRLKSVFLASMSHELRTPLNSIIGFTSLLHGGVVGPINDEQKKQLGLVQSSANHLLSLINDVLDIAKIEADKIELMVEQFDLSDIMSEVVQSFEPIVAQKRLELNSDYPDNVVIYNDKRRAKQVLMNLLSNAVKFTDSGTITVTATVAHGKRLEVKVADTGIGMKEESLDRLFTPFEQVGSLTKKHQGTGLGLYLSKKLSNLMGGDITVESEYEKGSTFTFSMLLNLNGGNE